MDDLSFRTAGLPDLARIIELLAEDPLGARREQAQGMPTPGYAEAFSAIEASPHNELIVVERSGEVIGVLQLTFIPGLTYQGGWRALIEAVRVAGAIVRAVSVVASSSSRSSAHAIAAAGSSSSPPTAGGPMPCASTSGSGSWPVTTVSSSISVK